MIGLRALATCTVLLVPAAAIGLSRASVFARQSASDQPRCANIQLAITPIKSQGALGHIGMIYRIHDTWGGSCTLRGYPGIELLDHRFHSLPTRVSRGHGYIIFGSPPEPQVTLDSSHDAYFGLEYQDMPARNESCPHAPYLMVIPPNDTLPVVTYSARGAAPADIAPCGGAVGVSPVHGRPTFR